MVFGMPRFSLSPTWTVTGAGLDVTGVILREGLTIVIEGERIVEVATGPVADATPIPLPPGSVLLPGFIDLHTHSLNAPLFGGTMEDRPRGPDGTLVYEFLMPVGDLAGRALSYEDSVALYSLSLARALCSGTTTVLDVFRPNSPALLEAARRVGIRAYCAPYVANHVIKGLDRQGRPVTVSSDTATQLRGLERFLSDCESFVDDRVRLALGPHCTDTCEVDLLYELMEMARDRGYVVSIHAAQSLTEVREMRLRYGKTPVEYLVDCGVTGPGVVYAHCSFAESTDLRLIADEGTALVSCPVVFGQGGHPIDFKRFLEHGVRSSIGTDGHSTSLLDEMRAAGLLARAIGRAGERLTAVELYKAVTVGPAAALARPDLGVIAVGAQADLVVRTFDRLVAPAAMNPLESCVWQPGATVVDTVFVAGEQVVEGGRPVRLDLEALVGQVSDAVLDVWRRAEEDLGITAAPRR